MRITFILIPILTLLLSCNSKGQETTIKVDQLEIIESDSIALKKYNWSKCFVNKKDTIIVLSDKQLIINCINQPLVTLEKVNSISDDIGYRFYSNNLYIDGVLFFPKEMEVYLLKCEE